jgi:hypothetical protein
MARRGDPVAQRDPPPFPLVCREQPGPAPPLDLARNRPGQPDGVTDAGVHAVAAGGRHLVHGIPGEPDPVLPIALCDGEARRPFVGLEDLEREVVPEDPLHQLRGVRAGGLLADADRDVQCVSPRVVLRDECPSGR